MTERVAKGVRKVLSRKYCSASLVSINLIHHMNPPKLSGTKHRVTGVFNKILLPLTFQILDGKTDLFRCPFWTENLELLCI